MTYNLIIKDIKEKKFKPIYFLCGNEPYFIDAISNAIEKSVLSNQEKAFNQTVFYGKDTNIETVITSARRYPMMSPYQVIIVKEAQLLDKIESIQFYAKEPLKTTILCICFKYKSIDRRKKFIKEINKTGVVFESKKLYDNQIQTWIHQQVMTKGCDISPKASRMLNDFLGNDLSKIDNELKKLYLNLNDEKTINSQTVEKYIGISKDYNNFELQNALGQKNALKAQQIVKYFGANQRKNPIYITVAVLFNYFNKILIYHYLKEKHNNQLVASKLGVNPFFVKDYRTAALNYKPREVIEIISVLREYDLKSKGVNYKNMDQGELLKELVYKIMH